MQCSNNQRVAIIKLIEARKFCPNTIAAVQKEVAQLFDNFVEKDEIAVSQYDHIPKAIFTTKRASRQLCAPFVGC